MTCLVPGTATVAMAHRGERQPEGLGQNCAKSSRRGDGLHAVNRVCPQVGTPQGNAGLDEGASASSSSAPC